MTKVLFFTNLALNLIKPNMNRPALISVIILFIVIINSCKRIEIITFEGLLEEMVDREANTRFPLQEYTLKQFSSYDRRSTGPGEEGWFANDDYTNFIGIDSSMGRKEYILFDHKGPGAIVRWWMTFAGEGSYEGTIRVYLDDSDHAIIEGDILDVLSRQLLAGKPLSSSVSPESDYYQRGHNLYLPIPYSRSCKISYECDSIRLTGSGWTPSIYYNINYRSYKTGTKVKTLEKEDLEQSKNFIEGVNKKLMEEHVIASKIKFSDRIKPGSSLHKEFKGPGKAIRGISLRLSADSLSQALRSTVLKISFDEIRFVWVPVGDFFGTGFELNSSKTWFSTVNEDSTLSCNWVMPFKNTARIELLNLGNQEITVGLHISEGEYNWDERSMYFGASWHEYNRVRTAGDSRVGGNDKHQDINFIDIKGKGVYVGDAICIFNTVDAWWGEGDEKIFVDNEDFPSSIGTGTEDYYGYAWCRPEPFSHPFIAQPTGSGNFHPGITVNLRYRSLDAIPFSEEISSNIELWHWVPALMNYAMTTYYYTAPAYSINIVPDKEGAARAVPSDTSDLID